LLIHRPIPMRTLIASCVLSLLTACSTDPVKQQQTTEVQVPVPVPCVAAAPEIPKTAMPDPKSADTAQLAAGAASDVYALQAYAERAHALLLQCAKQPEETQ